MCRICCILNCVHPLEYIYCPHSYYYFTELLIIRKQAAQEHLLLPFTWFYFCRERSWYQNFYFHGKMCDLALLFSGSRCIQMVGKLWNMSDLTGLSAFNFCFYPVGVSCRNTPLHLSWLFLKSRQLFVFSCLVHYSVTLLDFDVPFGLCK